MLTCVLCPVDGQFTDEQELEIHIAVEHVGLLPYKCDRCKYARFPTEYSVRYHYKEVHNVDDAMSDDLKIHPTGTEEDLQKQKEVSAFLRASLGTSETASSIAPTVAYGEECINQEEDDYDYIESSAELDRIEADVVDSYVNSPASVSDEREEEAGPSEPKRADRLPCMECGFMTLAKKSSFLYHVNTRHLCLPLFQCRFRSCQKTWLNGARSEIERHVRRAHNDDQSLIQDNRVLYHDEIREAVKKFFPYKISKAAPRQEEGRDKKKVRWNKKKDFRLAMLTEYLKGSTVRRAVDNINHLYGKGSILRSTCGRWFRKFRRGDISLEDAPGRGSEPHLDNAAPLRLLNVDNKQITRELAEQLGVYHSTVSRHMPEMGFKSTIDGWVQDQSADLNISSNDTEEGLQDHLNANLESYPSTSGLGQQQKRKAVTVEKSPHASKIACREEGIKHEEDDEQDIMDDHVRSPSPVSDEGEVEASPAKPKQVERMPCLDCGLMTTAQNFAYHVNTRHLRHPIFKCLGCQKIWLTTARSDIAKHVRMGFESTLGGWVLDDFMDAQEG